MDDFTFQFVKMLYLSPVKGLYHTYAGMPNVRTFDQPKLLR